MKLVDARKNEALNAWIDNLNSSKIRAYAGTKPANANTALSGNTLLAEMTGSATFAASASAGVLTANAISDDVSADATGTCTFVRIFESDGTTVFADLTVSATGGGGDVTFPTLSFTIGVDIGLATFTLTIPDGS